MLGALTTNLITAGITTGASAGAKKVREILRRKAFDEEIGEVPTEFNRALRDTIQEAAKASDSDALTAVALDWDEVAKELDKLDIVFESETDAVERIVDAIEETQDYNFGDVERQGLERAIIEAYGDAVTEFEQRIVGTELGEVLRTEREIFAVRNVSENV